FFPGFRRLRTSAAFLGTRNADRFSKTSFGFLGGTPLRGFSTGDLRAERAVVLRGAYGIVVGEVLRLEGIYEHAFVSDAAADLHGASFGGAGISGQLPGPFSTFVRLDLGTPIVGRGRGPRGVVLGLGIQRLF